MGTRRKLLGTCTVAAVVGLLATFSCETNDLSHPTEPGSPPPGFLPEGGGPGLSGINVAGDCLNELPNGTDPADERFNMAVCEANEVEIKRLEAAGGPVQCIEGDDIQVDLIAFFGLNATERFDVGYYLALDGGNAQTGDCFHGFLEPIENGGAADPLGGNGPFRDLEDDAGDVCGDIAEADEPGGMGENADIAAILEVPETLTLTCVDPNEDGFLDLPYCTSWDNNEQDTCEGLDDAVPGTTSKCFCDTAQLEIQVVRQATVKVIKDLIPSTDAGRFDLRVLNASGGQEALADDVGDGGMATATISWFAVDEPDSNKAVVQEFAGTPNPGLSEYDTSFTCVETGSMTTIGPTSGTGPQTLELANGDAWECTFTNTRKGTIKIQKRTVPVGGTGFGFTDDIEAPNAFSLNHGQEKVFDDVSPGTYMVVEDDPNPEYDLTGLICVDSDAGGTASTESVANRKATINLDPGETVTCRFTNTARAMVEANKTESGSAAAGYDFEIRQGADGLNSGDVIAEGTSDASGDVEFACAAGVDPDICQDDSSGVAKIVPGDYQFCEVHMMPGFSNNITGFTPNGEAPEGDDNSTECVDITLAAGQMGVPSEIPDPINNEPPPGGDARTIGFWKNWTSCDGNGNQDPVLDFWLADAGGFLIGDLTLGADDCEEAVLVLDKRDLNGNNKKRANDACYALASQMLAALLNVQAGANSCQELTDALDDAQDLLDDNGYDGSGQCLGPKDNGDRSEALDLASELDAYNNNEPGSLCN